MSTVNILSRCASIPNPFFNVTYVFKHTRRLRHSDKTSNFFLKMRPSPGICGVGKWDIDLEEYSTNRASPQNCTINNASSYQFAAFGFNDYFCSLLGPHARGALGELPKKKAALSRSNKASNDSHRDGFIGVGGRQRGN